VPSQGKRVLLKKKGAGKVVELGGVFDCRPEKGGEGKHILLGVVWLPEAPGAGEGTNALLSHGGKGGKSRFKKKKNGGGGPFRPVKKLRDQCKDDREDQGEGDQWEKMQKKIGRVYLKKKKSYLRLWSRGQ